MVSNVPMQNFDLEIIMSKYSREVILYEQSICQSNLITDNILREQDKIKREYYKASLIEEFISSNLPDNGDNTEALKNTLD